MNITNWTASKISMAITVAAAEHKLITEPKMIARDGRPRMVRIANQIPLGPRAQLRPQVDQQGSINGRANLAEQIRRSAE